MTYELASLDLSTSFDADPVPLAVPGTVGRGDDPALVLLDGASRGAHRLARLRRQEALAGIDVEVTGRPLRVTVVLLVDDHATRLWRLAQGLDRRPTRTRRRSTASSGSRSPAGPRRGPAAPPDRGRARLPAAPHRRGRADEVGPGGLLTLGFDVPEHLPSWTRRRLLPTGSPVCAWRASRSRRSSVRPRRDLDGSLARHQPARPAQPRAAPPRRVRGNPGSGESLRLVLSPRAGGRAPDAAGAGPARDPGPRAAGEAARPPAVRPGAALRRGPRRGHPGVGRRHPHAPAAAAPGRQRPARAGPGRRPRALPAATERTGSRARRRGRRLARAGGRGRVPIEPVP